MPTPCKTCHHPARDAIDRALVEGGEVSTLAKAHGLTRTSVRHHAEHHLPEMLARSEAVREGLQATIAAAEAARTETRAIDLMSRLERQCELGDKLADACERWLADPNDPTRFDVGPRDRDITVIYGDGVSERTGEPIVRKSRLDVLLARIEAKGLPVLGVEAKPADPRELIVKLLAAQTRQTELLARVLGKLQETAPVDVLGSPEWNDLRRILVDALAPFPDAGAAVAMRLMEFEASNARQ